MSKFNCAYKELLEVTDPRIIPNPKNPNKHPVPQIERLAKIIDYQGQRSPIVISNQSGFITKGHGRLEAIKKLGWKKIAVDFQDYENEAQEYADIVSDNAIAEWSDLSLADVNFELAELGPDFDIEILGIQNFKLDVADLEMTEKIKDDLNQKFVIEVTFPNDMEMNDIKDDLISRGYIVKVK